MPEALPLARTNAEARLFLQLQPCPRCGSADCVFRSTVVTVDGVLAGRYRGDCPGCGTVRTYEFRVPDEVLPPPAGTVRFGADIPSELMDPGVWLWYSDICGSRVPADADTLDEQGRRAARHALATALAAVEEVLKFLPSGVERLTRSACTTERGRAIYDREPARLTRTRLEAVRDAYAQRLEAW
ncbi:hypothetical protein [Nocardia aurantia]|uniref:hypothetical protein n=1 Tax=Nocardia aurantia TaxID=2585199 RepID=UPI001D12EE4D|nr:hypothetical protein [Nocardia aurantia]